MLTEYKKKTNLGIGGGILLQVLGRIIMEAMPGNSFIGFLLILAGFIMFIWGCSSYAVGKGYSQFLGILGFLSCLGLVILAVLPDKHKSPPPIK
jgi:hypothetical protein